MPSVETNSLPVLPTPAVKKDSATISPPTVIPESHATSSRLTESIREDATRSKIALWLHVLNFICAIIALSCTAAGLGWPYKSASWTEFLLFVSASAFILDIFFIGVFFLHEKITELVPAITPRVMLIIEGSVTSLWTLFWFAGATAFAANKPSPCASYSYAFTTLDVECHNSTVNAAIVFSYICVALTSMLAFISVYNLIYTSRCQNSGAMSA